MESMYNEVSRRVADLVSDTETQKKFNNPTVKSKIKILVVEDNALGQMLIRTMLDGWGFDFDICGNGKFAVEILKTKAYNLILMDILMPEMNGYETTTFIRNRLRLKMPIIAMTALSGERDKWLKFGMTDYISKPIVDTELLILINKYLK